MANHKSAIKRHKQSEKRRLNNSSTRSALKTAVKKVKEAIAGSNAKEAQAHLKNAISLLDRAVVKGTLHRNNASRRISRLTNAVNAIAAK